MIDNLFEKNPSISSLITLSIYITMIGTFKIDVSMFIFINQLIVAILTILFFTLPYHMEKPIIELNKACKRYKKDMSEENKNNVTILLDKYKKSYNDETILSSIIFGMLFSIPHLLLSLICFFILSKSISTYMSIGYAFAILSFLTVIVHVSMPIYYKKIKKYISNCN